MPRLREDFKARPETRTQSYERLSNAKSISTPPKIKTNPVCTTK